MNTQANKREREVAHGEIAAVESAGDRHSARECRGVDHAESEQPAQVHPAESADSPLETVDEDSTALTDGPALSDGEDAGDAGNSEYVLRVMVSDPSTASATVNVIVRVTNVNVGRTTP